MPTVLCLSVTFLDPTYHGQQDGGEPEWPPSPLRLFQAILAASAARWHEGDFHTLAVPALRWMETLSPPLVVAPPFQVGVPVRIAVPNNDLDVVAASWARGQQPRTQPAKLKTMKAVNPVWLRRSEPIHYLWSLNEPISEDVQNFLETLFAATRSMVTFGWGMDLVAVQSRLISDTEIHQIAGEIWRPTTAISSVQLRIPTLGSLDALVQRHRAFLDRLKGDGYTPLSSLSAFNTIGYRRSTDPAPQPVAAFEIWKPIAELAELRAGNSKFRPFDVVRRTPTVAGMVRHAVAEAARRAGWPEDRINTFIHGHTQDGSAPARGNSADTRFAYVPLPSLERRGDQGVHVGMIRRLLIVGPSDATADVAWARRALSGQELIPVDRTDPIAMLSVIPHTEQNLQQYLKPSAIWSTVTPVVLPGYDDPNHLRRKLKDMTDAAAKRRLYERLDARTEGLLRKAVRQAGFSDELAQHAELSWRLVGYRPGLQLATQYHTSDHLRGKPRYHVRIRWLDANGNPVNIAGPVVLGAGRYCGLGLFAAE